MQCILRIFVLASFLIPFGCSTTSEPHSPASSLASSTYPPLSAAEFKTFTDWLNTRVDLLIKHKASCSDLATALVNHALSTQKQVQSWQETHLDQRLIEYMYTRPNDEKLIKALLQKGGMVYSFCAFFPSFHNHLRRGIEIGL